MTAQHLPCRDNDRHQPDEWFPETPAALERAKKLCAGCPFDDECLEVAMRAEHGTGPYSRYGIFGGLTPNERYAIDRKIVRKRNAARRAAAEIGGDS